MDIDKEINALELRKRFGEIMDEIRYRKIPYVVKKNGRRMIVMMDIEVYETLKARKEENAFVEEYTDERIREFSREDRIDEKTKNKIRKILGQ